jgi:hypothetical protein
MNISPDEAQEALADIQKMTRKTRHSIVSSGAYIFLIFTGIIWLVGFLANQFLSGPIVVYIWAGTSLAGSICSFIIGNRKSKNLRSPSSAVYGKRIGLFWAFLALYCIGTIAIIHPGDDKQLTMIIILFVMLGQTAMGLLFSYSASWWALPLTALALAGYFLLPQFFYLWMAILVGGGMIVLGLYIRLRW